MKKILTTMAVCLFNVVSFAQISTVPDSLSSVKPTDSTGLVIKIPKEEVADTVPDPARNMYGGLMNDDPVYNRKYPWWIPASRVAFTNVFNWAVSRYVFNYDWARISPTTWKNNLKSGWEWDNDRFGINFIGHPHSGNNYFNIARSNGYNVGVFW
jgi:hypothetical protein